MTMVFLIILGIIQGLTEFLPVSSSGHLVLLYNIFDIEDNTILLSIIFHIATLLAVIIYYRKDIWILITHPFCPTNLKILVTSIFTFIVYLIISPIVDIAFGGSTLPIFFTLTAIILFVSDIIGDKSNNYENLDYSKNITHMPISYTQAIIIGISQGIAVIPGISRSGTTIATSKIIGCGKDSTKYSFLISIPIIIGSLLLEILRGGEISSINVTGLIISFVICMIIGILSIKVMTSFVKKNKLSVFSYYLIILTIFLLLNDFIFKLF